MRKEAGETGIIGETMLIETKNLIIRQYEMEDVAGILPVFTNPTTMEFWPRPFTMQEVEDWAKMSIRSYSENGYGRYVLLLKEENVIIGDCGLIKATIAGENVHDLGYIIHFPYWRRGYATEAASAVKEYAFRELNLDALHANMPYNHIASRRVAEKLGMQRIKEFDNPRNRNIRTFLYAIRNPAAWPPDAPRRASP